MQIAKLNDLQKRKSRIEEKKISQSINEKLDFALICIILKKTSINKKKEPMNDKTKFAFSENNDQKY